MKIFLSRSAQKELDKIPESLALKIRKSILSLEKNPISSASKKLNGEEGYRIRIGTYRVVYTIDKRNKEVVISKIAHRRDVYK